MEEKILLDDVVPCFGVDLRTIEVTPQYVVGRDGESYVFYQWEGAEIAIIMMEGERTVSDEHRTDDGGMAAQRS